MSTTKKATNICIAVGAVIALFGAAAGLSRPGTNQSAASLTTPGSAASPVVASGTITTPSGQTFGTVAIPFAPVTKQSNHRARGAIQPSQPIELTSASPSAPAPVVSIPGSKQNVAPQVPAPRATKPRDDTSSHKQEAAAAHEEPNSGIIIRNDEGLAPAGQAINRQVLPLGPGALRDVSFVGAAQNRLAERFGINHNPLNSTSTSGCGGVTASSDECGEDAWYHTTLENAFIPLTGKQTSTGLPRDFTYLDDGNLGASAVTVCGVSMGYVTNLQEVVRLTVRVFSPAFVTSGSCDNPSPVNVANGQDKLGETATWCAPGSPDGTRTAFISTYTLPTPKVIPSGAFGYMTFIDSSITSTTNNDDTGIMFCNRGVAITSVEPAGSFRINDNGNDNCCQVCSASTTCVNTGVFFGGVYTGFYLALHTTTPRFGVSTPSACDIDHDNNTTNESAATCDGGAPNGVNDNDRLAMLAFMTSAINAPVTTTNGCADIDSNGKIECLDYETFSLCIPIAVDTTGVPTVAVPNCGAGSALANRVVKFQTYAGTTQSGTTATSIILDAGASSVNNFYVGLNQTILFNTGPAAGQVRAVATYNGATRTLTVSPALSPAPSAGGGDSVNIGANGNSVVPGGEFSAFLPFDVPDFGSFTTNAQTIDTSGSNGIGDLDIDLKLIPSTSTANTAMNNGDYAVTLVHNGVTATLINQPYNANPPAPSRDDGFNVMLDDGESSVATNRVQFARSNFTVFGRYKAVQPLSSYVGRQYGGAYGSGNGAGAWRFRIRDLITGDDLDHFPLSNPDSAGPTLGTLVSWSVHVKIGVIVTGFIPSGVDRFRTLSCRSFGTNNGRSAITFGQPADIDPGVPVVAADANSPLPSIPAGFFDPGSSPYTGQVRLEGYPVDPTVSDYDTEVARTAPVNLNTNGSGGFILMMNQWNLKTCEPIHVAYSDRTWTEDWNIGTGLDSDQGSYLGALTLYPTGAVASSSNGSYWARWRIRPKLTFTMACDASEIRLLTMDPGVVIEMSTGAENDGNPSPSCTALSTCGGEIPGATDCRVPYVNDSTRNSRALTPFAPVATNPGNNPNKIVPGDLNFVPNVTPGVSNNAATSFDLVEAYYDGLYDDNTNPIIFNLNWAAQGVMPPRAIPTCGSPAPTLKDLPTDLVSGTWGTVPFTPLIPEACQPFVGVLPVLSGLFAITSDNKPGFNLHGIDAFDLPPNRSVSIGAAAWTGAYGSSGANTDIIDIAPNLSDIFTLEFYPDIPNSAPPRPDIFSPYGVFNIGDGNRVRRPDLFKQPNNTAPYYNYSKTISGPTFNGPGRFWFSVYNHTATLLPDPGTPNDTNISRWRWVLTSDDENDGKRYSVFHDFGSGVPVSSGEVNNANYAYCLFEGGGQTARQYCASSVVDNTCGRPASGLSYLVTGGPNGSGDGVINGTEIKAGPTFFRNRWNDVRAPFKNNDYVVSVQNGKLINVDANSNGISDVKEALQALLGSKAAGYSCQLNAIFASLPTNGAVDHVFFGKMFFDTPEVSGSIDNLCRQSLQSCEQGSGQEYASSNSRTNTGTVLHNNLDVFGVALTRTNCVDSCLDTGHQCPLDPPNDCVDGPLVPIDTVGHVVFYTHEQDKDCNSNGIDDYIDIASGTATDCNSSGIPDSCELVGNDCNSNGTPDDCDEDCNNNGRPDPCDLTPICTSGCSSDCDSNIVPDECQPDCDGDAIPDACEIATGADGGHCTAGPIGSPCAPNGNTTCSHDCNGDGIPDCCQAGAGNAPAQVAQVQFTEAGYSLGQLDPSGTTGVGQNGWESILGPNVGVTSLAGGNVTFPSFGAEIVSTGPTGATCFTDNRALKFADDPAATIGGTNGFYFSWGVRSPTLVPLTDTRSITEARIELFIPTPIQADDLWTVFTIMDPNTGGNTLCNGIWIRSAPSNGTGGAGMDVWQDGVVTLFDFPIPQGVCFELKMVVDDTRTQHIESDLPFSSPVNGTEYYIDGKLVHPTSATGTCNSPNSPNPQGTHLLPTQFAVGSNDAGVGTIAYFDNFRFFKGTPYDSRITDCDGNGLLNGCEIRDMGKPDCNTNGIPDACDIEGSNPGTCQVAAGTHPQPNQPNFGPTTRPCSHDCNSDGIPDECNVPAKTYADYEDLNGNNQDDPSPQVEGSRRIRLIHNYESTNGAQGTAPSAISPNFNTTASALGQPAADVNGADDDHNGIYDAIPYSALGTGGGPGIPAPRFAPSNAFVQISTIGACPTGGGNAKSLGMLIDDGSGHPTDGGTGYGIATGIFGREDKLFHHSRQRVRIDMQINSGVSTWRVNPTGDFFDVVDMRFARGGIDYAGPTGDDYIVATPVNIGTQSPATFTVRGTVPANEIQIFKQTDSGNFGRPTWASFNPPLLWPATPNTCFRVVVETDRTKPELDIPRAKALTRFDGSNCTVGLDLDMDGVVDVSRVISAPSCNARIVFFLTDNRIDADPATNPGAAYFDNVTIDEYDSYNVTHIADANTNGVPDACEAPACTCPGDMNGDGRVNGLDVKDFVRCFISGGAGCACADMDSSGGALTATDRTLFITKVLTHANSPCPP